MLMLYIVIVIVNTDIIDDVVVIVDANDAVITVNIIVNVIEVVPSSC